MKFPSQRFSLLRKILITITPIFLLLIIFSIQIIGITNTEELKKHFKKFIAIDTLENVGFGHINPDSFQMVFDRDSLFILNMKDRIIVKFKENKPEKIFKGEYGQGPKSMLYPRSIFIIDPNTIGIYDFDKSVLLYFDRDLNYIEEKRVPSLRWKEMNKTSRGITTYYIGQDKIFAFLDQELNPLDRFVEANKKSPVKSLLGDTLLNQGYFLRGDLVANGFFILLLEDNRLDIYDVKQKKLKISLHWKHLSPPNQSDIDNFRNLTYTLYVDKLKSVYVVENLYCKDLKGNQIPEVLIFNENGNIIYRETWPFRLMSFSKTYDDSLVYVMDDDEGISYIDIMTLLNKKLK